MKNFPLDTVVTDTITIIKNTLDLSENYVGEMKLEYASDSGCIEALNIIKHVLRTMSAHKKIPNDDTSINYRENDYFRILWFPL